MSFLISRARSLAAAAVLLVPSLAPNPSARASDHVDTAENVNRLGADLTDLYIFPSPTNANNVVLVMNSWSLIPAGQTRSFDPQVLYQFKIDTTGDSVEDLVIQAKFEGVGPDQRVRIAGPMRPQRIGTTSLFTTSLPTVGRINTIFNPTPGMTVFAGLREDPFFLDFEQFVAIFPDRVTPVATQRQVETPDPNAPQQPGFRNPGMDFFANLNILSIVVELPRASLGGGVIRTWMTTSVSTGSNSFRQQDRLARPLINEALVTVSNRRSEIVNKTVPSEDDEVLINDLESFLTFPAERSRAIKDVILSILVPDVMIADLREAGPAAYLGVETMGATGGRFGGRKLTDDVVDIDLMVVFGTVISDLGLAPPDGMQKPSFASDNTGFGAKAFLPNFPFLGNPR